MLLATGLLGSCTTQYQDMLRDRDAQIRELSGRVAVLQGEKDDLERVLASERAQPKPAPVTAEPAGFRQSDLQSEIGEDANVSYRRGRLTIGVDDTVAFDSGSTKLKDSGERVLRKIAAVLTRDFASSQIFVEGHTDSDPIDKTRDKFLNNRHLSAMRAESVASYLVKQGEPQSRIVILGYGDTDPRDPKSKAKNRRVEIVPVRQ
jgi:flagellar motor protein MotB